MIDKAGAIDSDGVAAVTVEFRSVDAAGNVEAKQVVDVQIGERGVQVDGAALDRDASALAGAIVSRVLGRAS